MSESSVGAVEIAALPKEGPSLPGGKVRKRTYAPRVMTDAKRRALEKARKARIQKAAERRVKRELASQSAPEKKGSQPLKDQEANDQAVATKQAVPPAPPADEPPRDEPSVSPSDLKQADAPTDTSTAPNTPAVPIPSGPSDMEVMRMAVEERLGRIEAMLEKYKPLPQQPAAQPPATAPARPYAPRVEDDRLIRPFDAPLPSYVETESLQQAYQQPGATNTFSF